MNSVLAAVGQAQLRAQEVIADREANPTKLNDAALSNLDRLSDAIIEAQALIDIEREHRGLSHVKDYEPLLEAQADLLAVMAVLTYGRKDWHRFNFDLLSTVPR